MTTQAKQTPTPPFLSATAAQLFVSDIEASCNFFTTKLGFVVHFTYGDPRSTVKRDNARLALRLTCEPVFVCDVRQREHLLSGTIEVNTAAEIKQLFLDFQTAGVKCHQTLKKEPWGARNFIVEDPHGNLILFAGPAVETDRSIARWNHPTCQGLEGSPERFAEPPAWKSSMPRFLVFSRPRGRSMLTSKSLRLPLLIAAFLQRWPSAPLAEHWLVGWDCDFVRSRMSRQKSRGSE